MVRKFLEIKKIAGISAKVCKMGPKVIEFKKIGGEIFQN